VDRALRIWLMRFGSSLRLVLTETDRHIVFFFYFKKEEETIHAVHFIQETSWEHFLNFFSKSVLYGQYADRLQWGQT